MRQSILQLLPGRTAVTRHVDRAAGPTAVLDPGVHLDLPRAGKEHVRIACVHRQPRTAGVLVDEKRPLPCAAAVDGFKHSALLLRPAGAAERTYVNDVGV